MFLALQSLTAPVTAGEDFDVDLTLDNIDFGTYVGLFFTEVCDSLLTHIQHIYPQFW